MQDETNGVLASGQRASNEELIVRLFRFTTVTTCYHGSFEWTGGEAFSGVLCNSTLIQKGGQGMFTSRGFQNNLSSGFGVRDVRGWTDVGHGGSKKEVMLGVNG